VGPGTGESGVPALQVGTGGGPGSGPVTLVADEEAPAGGGDGGAAAPPDSAAGAADGAGAAAAESQPLLRGAAGAAAAAAGAAAAPASGAAPAAAKAAAAPGAGAEQAPAPPMAAAPAAAAERPAAPAAPGLERCETRSAMAAQTVRHGRRRRGRHGQILVPCDSLLARIHQAHCLPACLLAGSAPLQGPPAGAGARRSWRARPRASADRPALRWWGRTESAAHRAICRAPIGRTVCHSAVPCADAARGGGRQLARARGARDRRVCGHRLGGLHGAGGRGPARGRHPQGALPCLPARPAALLAERPSRAAPTRRIPLCLPACPAALPAVMNQAARALYLARESCLL